MIYPHVILHALREQSWVFGHPWIYSKAIKESPKVPPGSLVSVFDSKENCIGVGTFHPQQTIALRMLTKQEEEINVHWFRKRFESLLGYRKKFLGPDTTAYRLCFGESDGLAGLVVDCYGNDAVLQINTKGMELLLPLIKEALLPMRCIVAPPSTSAKKEGVQVVSQTPIPPIWAKENGLDILVPLQGGQKTGWFCDQRDHRALVRRLSCKSVLNLCSYTGGFSLAAMAGGATYVVSVDQDVDALGLFLEMKQKNKFTCKSQEVAEDVWQFLKEKNETFDLVICDPPAFAKEEAKKKSALKGYFDLFKMSISKVSAGGLLMVFSCSHFITEEDLEWVLRQAYTHTGRLFQTVQPLRQGFDHPVPAWFKESYYLKGFLLKEILC